MRLFALSVALGCVVMACSSSSPIHYNARLAAECEQVQSGEACDPTTDEACFYCWAGAGFGCDCVAASPTPDGGDGKHAGHAWSCTGTEMPCTP